MMDKKELISEFLESAEIDDLMTKATSMTLKDSADCCVDTIFSTRRRIQEDGPKEFWLQDIENSMTTYRHLAHCYHYYTGKYLPTIEERLKDNK